MLSMLCNYSLLTEVRIPQQLAFVNAFRVKFTQKKLRSIHIIAQKNRRFLRNGGSIL